MPRDAMRDYDDYECEPKSFEKHEGYAEDMRRPGPLDHDSYDYPERCKIYRADSIDSKKSFWND
jgi:hypothetical protein